MKEGSETGVKARGYIESGALVPDEIVLDLVAERLAQPDCQNGYLLDGFPRTLNQAEALEREAQMDAVVNIQVPEEVIVKRLTSRRMCKECGYIGSVADASCPKCGGEMYQRDDDNEATVRNRLDVYEKSTSPLIDYYRGCNLLVSIDGDRDVDVVYADVKKALGC